jgi:hypothetical protein
MFGQQACSGRRDASAASGHNRDATSQLEKWIHVDGLLDDAARTLKERHSVGQ